MHTRYVWFLLRVCVLSHVPMRTPSPLLDIGSDVSSLSRSQGVKTRQWDVATRRLLGYLVQRI